MTRFLIESILALAVTMPVIVIGGLYASHSTIAWQVASFVFSLTH